MHTQESRGKRSFLCCMLVCFIFGIVFTRVVNTHGVSDHFDVFINWVKVHTVQRVAASELEYLGQLTGLPIQIRSASWPGMVAVSAWSVAAISGIWQGVQVWL